MNINLDDNFEFIRLYWCGNYLKIEIKINEDVINVEEIFSEIGLSFVFDCNKYLMKD